MTFLVVNCHFSDTKVIRRNVIIFKREKKHCFSPPIRKKATCDAQERPGHVYVMTGKTALSYITTLASNLFYPFKIIKHPEGVCLDPPTAIR